MAVVSKNDTLSGDKGPSAATLGPFVCPLCGSLGGRSKLRLNRQSQWDPSRRKIWACPFGEPRPLGFASRSPAVGGSPRRKTASEPASGLFRLGVRSRHAGGCAGWLCSPGQLPPPGGANPAVGGSLRVRHRGYGRKVAYLRQVLRQRGEQAAPSFRRCSAARRVTWRATEPRRFTPCASQRCPHSPGQALDPADDRGAARKRPSSRCSGPPRAPFTVAADPAPPSAP